MKKKSLVWIVVLCVCFMLVGVGLLIPIKSEESVVLPALMICDGESETQSTNITIAGTWTRSIAIPDRQSFTGKIQIDSLDYTHQENSWDLNFQLTDDITVNCLSGGFFYNDSDSDFTGYGWLYTNKEHDYYVIVTNQFNNENEDYIVIAPAVTEVDAKQICEAIGLHYFGE